MIVERKKRVLDSIEIILKLRVTLFSLPVIIHILLVFIFLPCCAILQTKLLLANVQREKSSRGLQLNCKRLKEINQKHKCLIKNNIYFCLFYSRFEINIQIVLYFSLFIEINVCFLQKFYWTILKTMDIMRMGQQKITRVTDSIMCTKAH